MSDSIFIRHPDGSLAAVEGTPFDLERDLQTLVEENPELIPGAQIDSVDPVRLLLLRSSTGVPSEEGGTNQWEVDSLFVDHRAVPTIVEVKRSTDTRIRREVVAQMLEYAANGTAYWRPDALRSWFETARADRGQDPEVELARFVGAGADANTAQVVEEFWSTFAENLSAGRVRLIFLADEIPATLRRLVEFLHERLPDLEVLAVEVRQYTGEPTQFRAIVPRLIGQTARAQGRKNRPAAVAQRAERWTEEDILERIEERFPEDLNTARAVLNWARAQRMSLQGGQGQEGPAIMLRVDGGSGGTPVRLARLAVEKSVRLELQFKTLTAAPFHDPEVRRRFYERFASLGVFRHTDDRSHKYPSVHLADVQDPGQLASVIAVLGDMADRVRGTT